MKNVELSVPQEARVACETLKNAGYEAYLVGGCVRDMLLGRTPKDWDVTTNATPEQIQGLFPDTFYENEYGTVGIVTESTDPGLKVIEITPYRIESEYSNARHPDEVRFSDKLSDDLKRRDFTVNAIAYDPIKNELVDEHGGREDLLRAILETVGDANERFEEDALRMLRAIRLCAELDFTMSSETMAGITENAAQLEKISKERIRDEFTRIVSSPRPMQALYMAQKLDILKYIAPELEKGIGCEQNQAHSYDVFEHNLRSLQHAADNNWSLDVRLAALFHDIGKPAVRQWSDEKKDWTFHGHDMAGAKIAKAILKDLRFSRETIENVSNLVRWHMFFSDPDTVTLSAVRRTIQRVGKDHIKELLQLRMCDRIGTGRPKEQPFRLRKYMSMVDEALRDPISVGMLAIDGAKILEMGEKFGPRVGWILHALLEEVLEDPKKNTAEYMENRAKELSQLGDNDLKTLGEAGKERKNEEEAGEIQRLREKHHVS
ncbi:HD domain-containing protein [Candidatus Parcubacteria bacterium]|nr:MAG: HD domain-containing protein [Candidatus Parcubacteria bacterium]